MSGPHRLVAALAGRRRKDIVPPNFVSGPTATNIAADAAGSSFDISFESSEGGDAWYVTLPNGATAPSEEDVKNGTDGDGNAAVDSGTKSISANTSETFNTTGLNDDTLYDTYVLIQDFAVNKQLSSRLDVSIPRDLTKLGLPRHFGESAFGLRAPTEEAA